MDGLGRVVVMGRGDGSVGGLSGSTGRGKVGLGRFDVVMVKMLINERRKSMVCERDGAVCWGFDSGLVGA